MPRFIGLIVAAGVAIWVYIDAKKRGYKTLAAVGWMLGIFLLMIVFLPLYLFLRARKVKQVEILIPCKYCGKYYEGSPIYCPNCGHKVGGYSFNREEQP
jgi:energy-coupling factor transporter transmembrane protein EcfT